MKEIKAMVGLIKCWHTCKMKTPVLFILSLLLNTCLFSQKTFDWHEVDTKVSRLDNNQYQFDITILPDSGWSLVSPFSKDSFWIPIRIIFIPDEHIESKSRLIENPQSTPSLDTFSKKQVNFISQSTIYSQIVTMKELPLQELTLEVLTMLVADNRSALPPVIWKFKFKYIDGELIKMEI